ncbi:hypothetical protein L3Q82_024830 [Scortum barcoo]|uniref:Uncharacterized protein n=1 Tax=Scortum barcoo TaxID=214431 RepID=A0ACB8WR16_9TELE|nr:hypothetical protein L3Q82_024830 [Scortum barcoo]
MSTQELFVAAARKCLSAGRKPLSVSQCLDLAAHVSAVDLGLKPALLYDSNGAGADQLQRYLSSLRSSQLVSKSLLTLDLNGNALIVNPVVVRSNVERLICGDVAVVDVCHSLERPAIANPCQLKSTANDLLLLLRGFKHLKEAKEPHYVGEESEEWNLCTVFGLLLGYPVTYWFDQTKSFENCLSMTPLMVTAASATWQTDAAAHRFCLYSFSVPAVLLKEIRAQPGKLEASFTRKVSAAKHPAGSHSLSVHGHSALSLFVMPNSSWQRSSDASGSFKKSQKADDPDVDLVLYLFKSEVVAYT